MRTRLLILLVLMLPSTVAAQQHVPADTYAHDGSVWQRVTFGTAGTPSSQVNTVQGIAGMTPLAVSGTSLDAITSSVDAVGLDTSTLAGAVETTGIPKLMVSFTALDGTPQTFSADAEVGQVAELFGPQTMWVANSSSPSNATVGHAVRPWALLSGLPTANLRNASGTEVGTSGAPLRTDPTGSTAQPATQSGTWTMQPGNTPNTTAWLVRTADPCTTGTKLFLPISQIASTQLFTGTASMRIYVCSLVVTQPTTSTQTWSLVNGTGTVCATGTAAMMGGTTAANGMAFGVSIGNGNAAVAKSTADAANVCILQSTTDRISGVLSYVVAAN